MIHPWSQALPDLPLGLKANLTPGACITPLDGATWRLEIPPGPAGRYRLAQLDDYRRLPRRAFRCHSGASLRLRARASQAVIPGTWGFGLWNDPFGMAILSGGDLLRLPALPNAAWFFFASPPSYLSLRDDLPAQGGLAATFRSASWPSLPLLLGVPFLPLLLLPPAARLFRYWARRIIQQEAVALDFDPTDWHEYCLEWGASQAVFRVDGAVVLQTAVAPRPPLGLVIWVDNQYAAAPPSGRLRYGMLPNPQPAWIEISDLAI
jgi:hypothetical protein